MSDLDQPTFITDPLEITAHLDMLVKKRIRGDLKTGGGAEPVKIIFVGYEGQGEGAHLLVERLIALSDISDRIDIGRDATVDYMADGAGYSFESRTVDIEESDGGIKLRFPSRLKKLQKRLFYRIQPSPFYIVVNTAQIAARCPVEDISGGGVSFLTDIGDDFMKPGTELKSLEFTLPSGYSVRADGILRSRSLTYESDPRKRYRCGVEFVGMPVSVQDKIVAYVFNLQKEELKWRREQAT